MADNNSNLEIHLGKYFVLASKRDDFLKVSDGDKNSRIYQIRIGVLFRITYLCKCPTRQTIRAREIATTYTSFTFHKNPSDP